MTTACMPTTPARGTRSLLSTVPETGRGQASLWTAAAAPDHRLWTTLRGPLDPSRLPTCPLPRRRRRASRYLSNTPIKKERRPNDLRQAPVAETALVNIDSPQTGGPFPSVEVGHTGLSKALAGEHPLRERLCGQLMLALYRSARQADATAVFHRTRRRLVDELGLEPGPDLQRLLT